MIGEPASAIQKVHFHYDRAKRATKYGPGKVEIPDNILSGFLEFDPANSYRVASYEFRVQVRAISMTDRGAIEYENAKEIPTVKKVVVDSLGVVNGGRAPYNDRQVSEYSIQYNVNVPDEEFRLSHYGLPEPNGVVWPRPTPWYLWIIGAGVVCLIASAYLWKRVARRAPAAA